MAEIHKASKDGQLYDMGGSTKSCEAAAELLEPSDYDIPPTSHVYSVSSAGTTVNLGSGEAPLPHCPLVEQTSRQKGSQSSSALPPVHLSVGPSSPTSLIPSVPYPAARFLRASLHCPGGGLRF